MIEFTPDIDFKADRKRIDFRPDPQEQEEDVETSYIKQAVGALSRGGMNIAGAIMKAPQHTFWANLHRRVKRGVIEKAGMTEDEFEIKRQQVERMGVEPPTTLTRAAGAIAESYENTIRDFDAGVKSILLAHPEWESEPPENFLDLVTSPRKLSLAVAESAPILIAAGITTAAGAPSLAMAMMYTVEGQQAHDEAKAYGTTDKQAETAYHVYGSVASVLEYMQLRGIMKIGKKAYGRVLTRTIQKALKRAGGKSLTREIIEVAAKEALEEAAQGAWAEATAKIVYDKPVEGGIIGFADRRAQEALIGFTMGVIPGAGGAVAGKVAQQKETDVRRNLTRYVDETDAAQAEIDKIGKESKPTPVAEPVAQIDRERVNDIIADNIAGPLPDSVIEHFTTGSEAKGTAKKGSDLDIAVVIQPQVNPDTNEDMTSTQFTEMFHQQYKTEKEVPTTEDGGRKIDIQFFYPGDAALAKLRPTPTKKPKLTRKRALAMGHAIPKQLGWDEEQRRAFMRSTTGKTSMKDMNYKQRKKYTTALTGELETAGLAYEEEVSPVDVVTETLEKRTKVTNTPIQRMNRSGIKKTEHQIKSFASNVYHNFLRIERLLESLDGHKDGPVRENIWMPIKAADEHANQRTNVELESFIQEVENRDIDPSLWVGVAKIVPRTKLKLTPGQRMGVAMLSKNKNGLRYLLQGMKMGVKDIAAVNQALTKEEISLAEWFSEKYEAQWPIILQAAEQAGIDPETLKKEFRYAPLIRTEVGLEEQEDFLSQLAAGFRTEGFSPEKGMLEERVKGAAGEIELDAFTMYMHNIARVERFVAMAPAAKQVGTILNSKKFRKALNNATYGHGSKLLSSWMQDAVKGRSGETRHLFGKIAMIARKNAIVYAIGYNIPSSLRQTLSMSNAIAVDPKMVKYVPANMGRAMSPSGFRTMQDFVYSKSDLVQTRSYDRDLRSQYDKSSLKKRLQRKNPFSRKAMRWIRWMDRHTVVVAWKSLYDTASEKGMDDATAIKYADKWIARTQPMGDAKDLPQFFRGGPLEKVLTAFQNQINNNGNFWMHDILGAKKTGEISGTTAAYRVMFSYVLPAIVFGMIGRGRLPKSWKDIGIDLSTYLVAPIILVGRVIDRIIRGWGQTGSIATAAAEEAVRLGQATRRGDYKGMIKHAALTVGAATGRIPAAAVRAAEGAIDIATGETTDPRRLIYSKWALEQGKLGAEDKTGDSIWVTDSEWETAEGEWE